MASLSKRKRNPRDMRCVLFPDDARETFSRKGTRRTPRAGTSSWERCGDSFLDTPMISRHDATQQTSRAVQQLDTSARRGEGDGEDPVHIAWTSSEDEQSDSERKAAWRSRPALGAISRCRRFLSAGADTDELPAIDSDSELEDGSTSKERSSPVAAEISDYSSDTDGDLDASRLDRSAQEEAERRQPSVSEWVRSAQALLQTPPKRTDKPSKTPEDSGKKRRKFESQGFAERLNRLQVRQKSAVSFWRHQPASGISTGTEERPGVLILHVQEVWEVCGMQAALGQRHPEKETCVALFSKETAAQLAPSAGDTIHVHPPWQSLTVDGERHPIILNTHFSQKVLGVTKQDNCGSRVLCLKQKTKPYPLTGCFWKREESFEPSQAPVHDEQTRKDAGGTRESLLDALEACGPPGSVCDPVEVVVQRIYFCPVAPASGARLLRQRTHLSGTVQQQHVGRCCLLVQDMYGMFGEVETQSASSEDGLKDLTVLLQGKVCLLKGLKAIQRLTRDRCAQLFSLIDSLWPPVVPPRVPGEGPCDQTGKVSAPSFCYRLTGRADRVLPKCESPAYRPPLIQTLKEILQAEPAGRRCSFKGTLIYKREQAEEERELLLFVTDPSLQDERISGSVRRTLPVYVSSALLLQTSVRQAVAALSSQFMPRLVFRDAVIEQGKIIVSGQSVLQLDSESSDISWPRSVLLDQLSPESPPRSLCTVTGVVMGIDESSAFSWPACRQCGSDGLEAFEDKPGVYACVACGVADTPSRRVQLEVFLRYPAPTPWTVKLKLQQNSIMSLLNSTGHSEGYEVEAVLGKSVGPLSAFIHVVTRSSALWMGLEEIDL